MDRQIRRLGLAFVALFALLFAQVGYVQVVAADRIANQPANAARQIRAEYAVERGQILAADRKTVLAESIPNEDPNSPYLFVRQYPLGELFGQLTGYYSQIYGRTGLEQAMNPYLAGTAPEFTTQNLTDIILGRPKRGGTVLTTLVPKVQIAAQQALGTHQGAVVAINPQNGDILAMYSNPSYDPNPLSSGQRWQRPTPCRRRLNPRQRRSLRARESCLPLPLVWPRPHLRRETRRRKTKDAGGNSGVKTRSATTGLGSEEVFMRIWYVWPASVSNSIYPSPPSPIVVRLVKTVPVKTPSRTQPCVTLRPSWSGNIVPWIPYPPPRFSRYFPSTLSNWRCGVPCGGTTRAPPAWMISPGGSSRSPPSGSTSTTVLCRTVRKRRRERDVSPHA